MLRQRLLAAGYAEAAVTAALDQAERHGYLNDRAFAEALVRRRAPSRGHGLIAQELRAKGLEDWASEPALATVDPEAELGRALAVGRGLLGRRTLPNDEALLQFLAPRLSRRGFGSGLVYRACRALAAERAAARLFDGESEHT
jgi:regulatory protein